MNFLMILIRVKKRFWTDSKEFWPDFGGVLTNISEISSNFCLFDIWEFWNHTKPGIPHYLVLILNRTTQECTKRGPPVLQLTILAKRHLEVWFLRVLHIYHYCRNGIFFSIIVLTLYETKLLYWSRKTWNSRAKAKDLQTI